MYMAHCAVIFAIAQLSCFVWYLYNSVVDQHSYCCISKPETGVNMTEMMPLGYVFRRPIMQYIVKTAAVSSRHTCIISITLCLLCVYFRHQKTIVTHQDSPLRRFLSQSVTIYSARAVTLHFGHFNHPCYLLTNPLAIGPTDWLQCETTQSEIIIINVNLYSALSF